MDGLSVADFLRFRADELADPEQVDFLMNLASEYEEVESPLVEWAARRAAMEFADHPDFREEWRVPA